MQIQLIKKGWIMGIVYEQTYRESLQNPEAFWAEAAKKVHWYNEWDRCLMIAMGITDGLLAGV